MILTLAFSGILLISLWVYFSMIGIFDFKRNPDAAEKKIAGRPSRRTVLRKNTDIAKAISGIMFSQFILNCAFYLTPELRGLISNFALVSLVVICAAIALYMMTPSNRMAHAYMTLGHVLVIHIICGLSVFYAVSAFYYNNYLDLNTMGLIAAMVVSVMVIFSGQRGTTL